MDRRQIIMNFTVPPSAEDLAVIAREALETLPEELLEFCEDIALAVEDIAEAALWLTSDEAFITGQRLDITAGQSLRRVPLASDFA